MISGDVLCMRQWAATHVLLLDLGLLLRSEVIHDVEELPDLFRSLTLDHVGHGLATDITSKERAT